MTMKEADEAGWKFLPVMCDGILYQRITRTGYTYDPRNGRRGFVQLLDKNSNSLRDATPESCTLPDYVKIQTEKEKEHEPNDERNTPREL